MRAGWRRRRPTQPDTAIQRPSSVLQPPSWRLNYHVYTCSTSVSLWQVCWEYNRRYKRGCIKNEKLIKCLLMTSTWNVTVQLFVAVPVWFGLQQWAIVSTLQSGTALHFRSVCHTESQAPQQKVCPHIITHGLLFMYTTQHSSYWLTCWCW